MKNIYLPIINYYFLEIKRKFYPGRWDPYPCRKNCFRCSSETGSKPIIWVTKRNTIFSIKLSQKKKHNFSIQIQLERNIWKYSHRINDFFFFFFDDKKKNKNKKWKINKFYFMTVVKSLREFWSLLSLAFCMTRINFTSYKIGLIIIFAIRMIQKKRKKSHEVCEIMCKYKVSLLPVNNLYSTRLAC